MRVYESIMDSVAAQQRENLDGQMDFFSMSAGNAKQPATKEIPLPAIPEFTPQELMSMEKATTGLYLSGHPVDHYREEIQKLRAPTIASIIRDFAQEGGPPALCGRTEDYHRRSYYLQQDQDHKEQ